MGTAKEPAPVKLVVSLLVSEPVLLDRAKESLSREYGAIDFESELLPFDHTDYYAAEFGPGLQRKILTFATLVSPGDLPAIKLQTNALEWSFAEGGKRRVNIDPGYVSLGKLVLASTKNHAHRLYLGEGIYGEGTLTFQGRHFRPWPWTYPDYASEDYCAMFDEIRESYKAQLRDARDRERDCMGVQVD
jgi:hypothetical protein